jgi:two-component system, OmpR family, alkaline phosphatase synthesis response regulator PhoP
LHTQIKILLVDDEPDILDFLSYNLKLEKYEVYTASNGDEAIQKADEIVPDIICLDLMMPGKDGIVTCSILKNNPKLVDTSIIFLTARNEDYLQIAGFDAGGEDYISKPIKPKLFVTRIDAIARRKIKVIKENVIMTFGELIIDKEKYQIFNGSEEISLTKKEFELLLLLSSVPGKVFDRDQIHNNLWGRDVIVGDRTIDVHISKLRDKIGERYIKTLKGIGYKFDF